MQNLKVRNPIPYQFLVDGGFTGSLSSGKHRKKTMDYIIEMKINRFSKKTKDLSWKTENIGASKCMSTIIWQH